MGWTVRKRPEQHRLPLLQVKTSVVDSSPSNGQTDSASQDASDTERASTSDGASTSGGASAHAANEERAAVNDDQSGESEASSHDREGADGAADAVAETDAEGDRGETGMDGAQGASANRQDGDGNEAEPEPDSHDVDATVPGNTLSADTLEGIDIDPRLVKAAEAMIFAADEPVPPHRIAEIFAEVTGRMQPDLATVEAHVRALNQEYQSTGRPLVIHEWAGGYRITTRPEMSPFVKALVVGEQETSLSRSLLETLAVLAYRQPVTRPEVDFVRGVNSDYAIRKLLDLGLADVKGRSQSLGRPLLYGTTDRFLEQFGLNTLEDLPTLREIEDLLDDPSFDEERSQLLQLDTEKEITDRETAKEVLSEARELVQKGELDADDFVADGEPGDGDSSEESTSLADGAIEEEEGGGSETAPDAAAADASEPSARRGAGKDQVTPQEAQVDDEAMPDDANRAGGDAEE